jgi:hypothetical protein
MRNIQGAVLRIGCPRPAHHAAHSGTIGTSMGSHASEVVAFCSRGRGGRGRAVAREAQGAQGPASERSEEPR